MRDDVHTHTHTQSRLNLVRQFFFTSKKRSKREGLKETVLSLSLFLRSMSSRKRFRPLDPAEERSINASQRLAVSLLQDERSYCFSWPDAPLTAMLLGTPAYAEPFIYHTTAVPFGGSNTHGVGELLSSPSSASAAAAGAIGDPFTGAVGGVAEGGALSAGATALTSSSSPFSSHGRPTATTWPFSSSLAASGSAQSSARVSVPAVVDVTDAGSALLPDGVEDVRHLFTAVRPRRHRHRHNSLSQKTRSEGSRLASAHAAEAHRHDGDSCLITMPPGTTRFAPHPLAPQRPYSTTEESVFSLTADQLRDVRGSGVVGWIARETNVKGDGVLTTNGAERVGEGAKVDGDARRAAQSSGDKHNSESGADRGGLCDTRPQRKRNRQQNARSRVSAHAYHVARCAVEQEVVGLEWRAFVESQRTAAALQRLLSLEAAVPFQPTDPTTLLVSSSSTSASFSSSSCLPIPAASFSQTTATTSRTTTANSATADSGPAAVAVGPGGGNGTSRAAHTRTTTNSAVRGVATSVESEAGDRVVSVSEAPADALRRKRDMWRHVVYELWLRWRLHATGTHTSSESLAFLLHPHDGAPLGAVGTGPGQGYPSSFSSSSHAWGPPLLAGAFLPGSSVDFFIPPSATPSSGGSGVFSASSAAGWNGAGGTGAMLLSSSSPSLFSSTAMAGVGYGGAYSARAGLGRAGADVSSAGGGGGTDGAILASRRRGAYNFLRWRVERYTARLRSVGGAGSSTSTMSSTGVEEEGEDKARGASPASSRDRVSSASSSSSSSPSLGYSVMSGSDVQTLLRKEVLKRPLVELAMDSQRTNEETAWQLLECADLRKDTEAWRGWLAKV